MTRYVALLYSIVLLEGKRLSMAPWKAMMEGLGLSDVQTLLATGNALFSAEGEVPEMEARLEKAFAETFGRPIPVIVRGAAAWRKLAAGNPFAEASAADGARVAVRVMRERLTPDARALLESRLSPSERMRVVDGDPWFHFPEGFSGSAVAGVLSSRRIGIGTARNWNTVARIARALGE